MKSDPYDPRHYGSILSLPRSVFNASKITSTGVSDLDNQSHDADDRDNFTPLKQLLVDLCSRDNEEFSTKHKSGNPVSWQEFYPQSRMYRFSKAFNEFFDHMTFSDVVTRNGEKEIVFLKDGMEIPIDNLSTGEKQIVYKGIYLLRNINLLKDGIVLIDEPELSLHPKWQDKILKYYQDLFSDATNHQQQVQLIIATHSERILTSAFTNPNHDKNGTIILKYDNRNVIPSAVNAPGVLPSVTAAETSYLAFEVPTVDYHIALYAQVQLIIERNTGSAPNVSQTDTFILNHARYNQAVHEKQDSFTNNIGNVINYTTLSTYVRNRIDHPRANETFSTEQLETSINLLREIIQNS